MKKIISFILLFAFTMNAFASTANISVLERHIDEFTFATTVASDGTDHSAYQANLDELVKKLKELKAAGLTQKEVVALLEKKIQNGKALEALRLKVSLMNDASTEDELKALFSESKDLYSQGASWNGTAVAIGGVGLILIAIAAYKFWWHANYECVQWAEEYQCRPSRCESTGSGDNETTTCYGEACGYYNECVRHEKKEK